MAMMGGGSLPPDILARIGGGLSNNSMALLGLAGGLLGGKGFAGGFEGMAQGSKIDQSRQFLNRDLADKEKKEKERETSRAALVRALGQDVVDQLGVSGASEMAQALELIKRKPKEPEIKSAGNDLVRIQNGQAERIYQGSPTPGRPSFDVQSVKMPDGTERPVRVNRATGDVSPLDLPGAAPSSGNATNPYATGKFNEGQGKAATYADRLAQAEDVFSGEFDEKTGQRKGGVAAAGLSRADKYGAMVPVFGNELVSPEYRKFDQASRNFINAVLRRESGAVISPAEFDNARVQYLPQPGDDPETLAQKAENRRTAFEGIARESGPAYRPPKGYGKQQQSGGEPPPQAVEALRKNPALRDQFDAKYGSGAAARVLGGQ